MTDEAAAKSLLDLGRRLLGSIARGVSDLLPPVVVGLDERRARVGRLEEEFNRQAQGINARLANREITLGQWRDAMQGEVQTLHTGTHIIGNGGWGGLSETDRVLIQSRVQEELQFLENWAQQLDAQADISEAQLNNRAAMYGRGSRQTFESARNRSEGLPPMPFQPGKRTQCRNNCGCTWHYVKLDGIGNWDAYWVRHKDDSCPTCIARETACSPLEIRGGAYTTPTGAGLFR